MIPRFAGKIRALFRPESAAMHASPNLSLAILTLGLLIFLGSHSVRIVADNWRTRQIARWGADGWKTRYSVVALVGLAVV
ncbi:MAG TPA: NnrU family protein, partial [Rhodocyclaceae bacterium]|nr:NnrU family protein [Rhodocyclaceae bacterium]